jgi:hypothetical protein
MKHQFKILIVRRDEHLYTRVVYQEGYPGLRLRSGLNISCCDCVELSVSNELGTVFMRGDKSNRDHECHVRTEKYVSDDIRAFVNSLNQSIKEYV